MDSTDKKDFPTQSGKVAKTQRGPPQPKELMHGWLDKTFQRKVAKTPRRNAASRNEKNFTEANEANEEGEEFCQKCATFRYSTATAQRECSDLAALRCYPQELRNLGKILRTVFPNDQ